MTLLATILDWFVKFPVLWGALGFVAGGIITGVVAVLIFRRYGDALVKVNDKIVAQQDKQLEMMERTLRMQKDHYEAEATEAKKQHEEALNEAKAEWQKCRKALHDEREKWHSESTKMQLVIQDLEGRPDMTSLSTAITEVVELIKQVALTLKHHDAGVHKRTQLFLAELKKISK